MRRINVLALLLCATSASPAQAIACRTWVNADIKINYDGLSGQALQQTVPAIAWQCSEPVGGNIRFVGGGYSMNFRYVSDGVRQLPYNIYFPHSPDWNIFYFGPSSSVYEPRYAHVTVKVPAGLDAWPGTYSDVIQYEIRFHG